MRTSHLNYLHASKFIWPSATAIRLDKGLLINEQMDKPKNFLFLYKMWKVGEDLSYCQGWLNTFSWNIWSSSVPIQIVKVRILILSQIWFGCITCSLALREERGLSVFENRVPRRIFGIKRDEITGGSRKLHFNYRTCSIPVRKIEWI
jgi:hypothetical protein